MKKRAEKGMKGRVIVGAIVLTIILGATAIVQAPGVPFTIWGQVFDTDGTTPVDGVKVTVKNLETDSIVLNNSESYAITKNGGYYIVNLGNLEPDPTHNEGDRIQITADNGAGKSNTTVVSRAATSPQQVDLILKATVSPPTIVSYTISNHSIKPAQATSIDVEFSETVDYRIAIEKDNATIYDWVGTAKDPQAKVWNGTYETNGTLVPPGVYIVNVTGTNTTTGLSVVNNTEEITVEQVVGVDRTPPTTSVTAPELTGEPSPIPSSHILNWSSAPVTLKFLRTDTGGGMQYGRGVDYTNLSASAQVTVNLNGTEVTIPEIGTGNLTIYKNDTFGDSFNVTVSTEGDTTIYYYSVDKNETANVESIKSLTVRIKTPVTYTLTITSTAGGNVTEPGEGTHTYDADTVVALKAVADTGYVFVNWTGDVDTIEDVNASETSITMNDNYTITANFKPIVRFEIPFSVIPYGTTYTANVTHDSMSTNVGKDATIVFFAETATIDSKPYYVLNISKPVGGTEMYVGINETAENFTMKRLVMKNETGITNLTFNPEYAMLNYPLWVGKTWASTINVSGTVTVTGATIQVDNITAEIEGKVTGEEYLTTPYGELRCLVVENNASISVSGLNLTITAKYWISDNETAKIPKYQSYTNGNLTEELVLKSVIPPVTHILSTIVVTPSTATLKVGDTQIFTATAKDQNGNPMAGINITWTSSNETVGNVSPSYNITDANGTATMTFTASTLGTTTIKAENGTVNGTATVTVEVPRISTIVVTPPTATLKVGDTPIFTATAKDQFGDPMAGINITWTSSNITVGNVSPAYSITGADGNATTTFTASTLGTTTIKAENGTVNGTATVTVVPQYNLTVSSTDGGSVTEPGEGTHTYAAGKVVKLKAVPNSGYEFDEWTGDVDTIDDVKAAETTITMNGNYTITANFKKTYRAPPGGGGGGGGAPRDSDGDGITDIEEMLQGTDPKDPCDPNPECAACKALMPAAPAPTTAPVVSPTPKPTVKPTPVPTPAPATPTPTPKPTPGYEAVFMIAGLLAVAYLVQRKRRK